MSGEDFPETTSHERWHVVVAGVASLVMAGGAIWIASGYGSFYETIFRVGPTVTGGGVGADWVAGNTVPVLDFAIALVHAADVIMGLFVMFLTFLHWVAFRRLAARMRQPGEASDRAVMADGSGEGGEGS